MMILANKKGNEQRVVYYTSCDFDQADTMDFSIEMPSSEYRQDLESGARIFIEGTEYGGLIGGLRTSSKEGTATISGRTWRGILKKKIIRPPSGQDYLTIQGDLTYIMSQVVASCNTGSLFTVEQSTTKTVTNKFDRYCTLYDGIEKMLRANGYKLVLEYSRGADGAPGSIKMSAKAVEDYSGFTEISQNNQVYFSMDSRSDKVNHLICLGRGDLSARTVIDLYLQKDGSISTSNQYYTGINEVVETYDYPNVESTEELESKGRERLLENTNYQTMSMDVESVSFSAMIGDIVGGRDYITGFSMKQPITNIIYKESGGVAQVQYLVDGDVSTSYDID